jgi:hypothetical protein
MFDSVTRATELENDEVMNRWAMGAAVFIESWKTLSHFPKQQIAGGQKPARSYLWARCADSEPTNLNDKECNTAMSAAR